MGRLIVRQRRLLWSAMLTASFVGFAVTQAGAQTDQAPTGALLVPDLLCQLPWDQRAGRRAARNSDATQARQPHRDSETS